MNLLDLMIKVGVDDQATGQLSGIGSKAVSAASSAAQSSNKMTKLAAKAGAVMGVVSSAVQAGMQVVESSVGSAVERVDLLNNFPRVMEAMGYSADAASASISGIVDHLQGLPTATHDMVGFVQQLAATTGDLGTATDVGLAFNDMILASGASTAEASNAMTQYNQMLAAGKVDQQAWNSLLVAAPGQLDQLAKSMLGAEANQKTLYEALKDGTVTFDDLNAAIVDLDRNGGEGFASFEEQARAATGGIGTAMDNVKNRIVAALAKIIEALGAGGISSAIDKFSSSFSGIADGIVAGIDFIKDHIDVILPIVSGLAAAFTFLNVVVPIVASVAAAFTAFVAAVQPVVAVVGLAVSSIAAGAPVFGTLAAAVGLVVSPIGALTAAIAVVVAAIVALATNAGGCRDKVVEAFTAVVDFMNEMPGKIAEVIASIISSISQWAADMVTKAHDAALGFMNGVVSYMSQVPGAVASFLASVISGVVSFAASMASNAAAAARNFVTNLVNGIASLPATVASMGSQIISGLVNGITAGAGRVVSALTGVVGSAVNAAKRALGIASPSKVFKAIGDYTMQGLELGIEGGSGGVVGAMRSAVGDVVGAASMTLPAVQAVPAAAAGSYASRGGDSYQINLTFDISRLEDLVSNLGGVEDLVAWVRRAQLAYPTRGR